MVMFTLCSDVNPDAANCSEEGLNFTQGSDEMVNEAASLLAKTSIHLKAGPYGLIGGNAEVVLPPPINTPGVALALFAGVDRAGMLFDDGSCL